MGKSEKRNVTVFVVTGVLLAGGVGLGVWQVSSPAAPTTTDIATTSTLSTTRAGDSSSTGGNAGRSPEILPEDTVVEEAAQNVRDDPFLAPNAVLPSGPEHSAPTTTYRPDNVVPLSPTYGDEPAVPADVETFRSAPSAAPAPVEPAPTYAPLEPETVPASPAQPTGPDAGAETVPEAESTQETEGAAPEPTPQPSPQPSTPSVPPQDEPEPTTPTEDAVDEQDDAAQPTPWERALSWFSD